MRTLFFLWSIIATSAAAFMLNVPSLRRHTAAATGVFMSDDALSAEAAKDLMLVIDKWESSDGTESDDEQFFDMCYLTDDEDDQGCCMVGPEPLLEVMNRLDVSGGLNKWNIEPALKRIFSEVLEENTNEWEESLMGEVGSPCVSAETMRSAIRAKAFEVAGL